MLEFPQKTLSPKENLLAYERMKSPQTNNTV